MATAQALQLARDAGLDLVEIASQANPPVAKIIDYNKYKYLEQKKEQLAKKGAKEVDTKEIKMRPFISEGDFQTRLKRIKEFLEDSDRVRVVVEFRGREIAKPEFGRKLIAKINDFVTSEGIGKQDAEPRMMGKMMAVSFTPVKHK